MYAPATMPVSSKNAGRRRSAQIVRKLREALEAPRASTYQDLARAAGCDERTVRNYLEDAESALGFRVDRVPGRDRVVRVRRAVEEDDAPAPIAAVARVLARDLLRRIFPLDGTDLDRAPRRRSPPVLILTRGAYPYEEKHLRALRVWLQAASSTPRYPVRFMYDAASSGLGSRVAWPLGMVLLRGISRVFLVGVPGDAEDARDVRTYALEWLRTPESGPIVERVRGENVGPPPAGIEMAVVDDAINAPFGLFRPTPENSVMVRVRFEKELVRYVEGRYWHRDQKLSSRPDGSIELEFGPADLRDATEWVREWGERVQVLGDERLLRALAQSLRASLAQVGRALDGGTAASLDEAVGHSARPMGSDGRKRAKTRESHRS